MMRSLGTIEPTVMKTPAMLVTWMRCWMAAAALAASTATAAPLGTGFTYQGQLIQDGNPVQGISHLRFSLWDAPGTGSPPAGGNQIGASQLVPDVPVTDGLFTLLLNGGGAFGPTAFNGDARWLQVEICADPGCVAGTILGPRQALTAAPYARHAAGPWQSGVGSISYSGGNVGVGTTAPTSKLEIAAQDALKITGFQPFLTLRDTNAGGARGALQSANGDFIVYPESFIGGNPALVLKNGTGNLGLGIPSPSAKLHVQGDVKLGNIGQYFAPGGEENLRLMRGNITENGTPTHGCCFSVDRPFTGDFMITFTTPFSGTPTVTATPITYFETVTCRIVGPTTNYVVIEVRDANGDPVNWGFNFCVMGPR